MTVIAPIHCSTNRAVAPIGAASTRLERLVNRAMTTLLWALPLLIVLLAARPVHGSVSVESVTEPLFVSIDLGSIASLDAPNSPERQKLISSIAAQIVAAAAQNPDRLVVLKPRDLTISYDQLPGNLRQQVMSKPQGQRATYEKAISSMLKQIVSAVRVENRSLPLSVNGLPIEPSPGGADLSEQTNLRYRALMNDLSAFVSARSIVASPSTIGEVMAVRQAMPAAVRLALGRPIYYRTDRGWHVTSGVPNIHHEEPLTVERMPGETGVGMIGGSSSGGTAGGSSDSGMLGSGGSGSSGGGGGGSSSGGGEASAGGSGVLSGTSGVNNRPGGGNTSGGSTGGGSGGSGSGGGGGSGSGGPGGGSGGGSGGTPPGPSSFKFYVNENLYPQVEAMLPQHGAERSIILGQAVMDLNDDAIFDGTASMQFYLDFLVPMDFDGPLCLDWEGLAAAYLTGPSDQLRSQTVQQFVLALEACKQLRPNAQVGMYGLPINEYFNHGPSWLAREQQFAPIYEASDCIFPSVYDFYKDGEWDGHDAERDATYVREVVEMAMRMGAGKPVYPYVWRRWHTANAVWGMQLIPESEFKPHVAAILEADYNGDKADGVVWWGADLYWRNISLQNIVPGDPLYGWHVFLLQIFNNEIPPGDTDVEHFTSVHTDTLLQIAEVIADETP